MTTEKKQSKSYHERMLIRKVAKTELSYSDKVKLLCDIEKRGTSEAKILRILTKKYLKGEIIITESELH